MPTLKKKVEFRGHGIHSGAPVVMRVFPSDGAGVWFVRTDMRAAPIPAVYDNVGATHLRNTTVGDTRGAHVQTIEHLMAALFIAGVDRARIEIDGPETPILDGSAKTFLDAFLAAGVTDDAPMRRIVVRRPVVARASELRRQMPMLARMRAFFVRLITRHRGDGYVKISPATDASLTVRATLVYPEKIIGAQTFEYSCDGTDAARDAFLSDVAAARTFGKFSEWEYQKAHGMARGADETNVIALNAAGDGTLNRTLWRDEFVRHKIIDAIGDMFTSGGFICGAVESYKGSHALNNLALKKLFSSRENYDIVEINDNETKA